ncbi:MAG: aminotransferase class V-fold PLP-dependent enzyme [Candidatus Altiarchaeota archaeon]
MDFSNKYKDYTIVNPLMVGGIVPDNVAEKLCSDQWVRIGYSVCFNCLEGRSSMVTKPNVKEHLTEVAGFFGGDVAEHTFGCRGAQFAVMKFAAEYAEENGRAKTVVSDPNSHYSTNIAAEMGGLKTVEPPHNGYPEYRYTAESFRDKIREVEEQEGKKPALAVVTHADPYYGNIAPAEEIGAVCEEEEVPYLINAAYTGGILPINLKALKADFLTVSAHKSMASLGPLGYVISSHEYEKKIFEPSKMRPDWSGRAFGKKIPNIFGCSVGGIPLISSMLSFDHVKKRVEGWEDELEKTRRFADRLEELGAGEIMLLGQNPHNHHLLHFETPVLWEISKTHKRKGFFLAEAFDKKNITGIHKGLTKHMKVSVYGLSDEQIGSVVSVFEDIISGKT